MSRVGTEGVGFILDVAAAAEIEAVDTETLAVEDTLVDTSQLDSAFDCTSRLVLSIAIPAFLPPSLGGMPQPAVIPIISVIAKYNDRIRFMDIPVSSLNI